MLVLCMKNEIVKGSVLVILPIIGATTGSGRECFGSFPATSKASEEEMMKKRLMQKRMRKILPPPPPPISLIA